MCKVSVVIPVYGQWILAKRNVDSLLKFDAENLLEIILVDDCSVEENPFIFDNPLVTMLKNTTNLGYAGTANNGLKHAKSKIIILLDSDAFLIRPIVHDLTLYLERNSSVGCLGFRAVDTDGEITGSAQFAPTLWGFLVGQALEARLNCFINDKNRKIIPFSCCLGLRKECLEDVLYFDAKSFPQVESDIDLSLRIHESTWKVETTEDIVVCHEGGNSYIVNNKRVRLYHRSKWDLLRKHDVIKTPYQTRQILRLRIKLELLTMRILLIYKQNSSNLREKISGRRQLLNDLKDYV